MRVTTKGQVTIPQHIREKLGIFDGFPKSLFAQYPEEAIRQIFLTIPS